MIPIDWSGLAGIPARTFICGFCGNRVASDKGYHAKEGHRIYICPGCNNPNFFPYQDEDIQIPGSLFGGQVSNLPNDVKTLYDEARKCLTIQSHTSAVLTCRKLLMNIAVSKGAKEGENFVEYVEYLDSKGYVPPDGKGWVDHIRNKGNEANHEIKLMSKQDAEELVSFLEMLLKFIYEFPARIPKSP